MSKSQMKLANRAWRKATKKLQWDADYPDSKREVIRAKLQTPFASKKDWKKFCRFMAETSVSIIENDDMIEPCANQECADEFVKEEMDCW